ncbi:flippase-like domain-containing protein [Myxococcus sp. CA051A]|uniref:Flippase-like domain-containing protein n=1 Tax=Myxococcus llanfairpwllgwyngyllgogerychwyrndrobwllllantysiliogogogochensis TaxID=2590453 RepID=A0A540WYK2_9BACT|nr:lysylphosphatidylglycerol synthase transmembrane domain-containing protein [Myxococcus llanfairpwllgwyngyllgogerychwyrndrobwllllantysiliogogogochensis]NTX01309.1 flippase-like domain-containing protein [Myxococcus sp. CA040A]NTX33000.1 flippase-like domain-containing protein [Myxococcus sp. CA033]NTX53451.1 flippase-like domain-containing protein [Myxococcus sp. CA039A]NTX59936.1 flippase-like domain-containing protein [Myxococcus sp. CA051A]TQF14087.1 flippase-like domain-containing protei
MLLAVLGLALSVVLLSTAFFRWHLQGPGPLLEPRFPLDEFLRDLPGHLVWLLPFVLLQASIIPLRAVQWQSTLRKRVPFRERYHLVAIGAFVHNALPGKLGDILRSFLLSRTERIPFLRCLGTVGVCKLMEFAALMLLVTLSLLGPFGATLSRFQGQLKVAVSLCVGLVALVVLLAHWSAPLANSLHRRHRFPRLEGLLHHVSDGLGSARSFRGMGKVLFFSVGPVLASALAYGLALHGIGIQGGLFAGAVMLGAISLGQALPGVPAGMGIYYFVTSWAARSLGASPEDAAAFATLTHLGTVLSQAGVGAISVYVRKIRIRDLRKGGSLAREAAHHVAHESVEPAPP